ncbi:MAG: CPBP family intramembrane metalloprotease [Candidatus Eremiobacteraeota bacterium]|nr:CPBP family intramembrane metalloprotease [Candidatus Eremiobacteraeota bacterium]
MKPIAYDPKTVRRCWLIIGAVTIVEGATIVIFWNSFVPPIFHRAAEASSLGWLLSAIAALTYIAYSIRGLELAPYMLRFPAFRILGPIMAVPTSILEEVFFRQYLMDAFARAGQGVVLQVVVSAVIFGIAHAFWGIRGGMRAALNAVASTTLFGILLGIVYLASDRVVLPCIVAHFAINCVVEPWLVYAYVRRALTQAASVVSDGIA